MPKFRIETRATTVRNFEVVAHNVSQDLAKFNAADAAVAFCSDEDVFEEVVAITEEVDL